MTYRWLATAVFATVGYHAVMKVTPERRQSVAPIADLMFSAV